MQLAVSHNNMDFDSLAAQFAVTKLYPTARMALAFPLFGNVREYLTLYRSNLPIVQIKYIDFAQVSKIFIVDCQHAERLEQAVRTWLTEKHLYTIFDHHELDPHGLGPQAQPESIIQNVGAATTLLVEKIIERSIALSPFEATLLLLGIYEDTGCLAYGDTTERDATCAAYLLKNKADLAVVNQYMRAKLDDEQLALLQEMIQAAQVLDFAGQRIIVTSAVRENYLDGLATITRKLMELESADAAFCAVYMRDRIHIVGRSDTRALDVRQVVRQFNGDGHAGAGAAVVKPDKNSDGKSTASSVEKIITSLRAILKDCVKPEIIAAQLMVTPVRTIRSDVSMEEAGRMMLRYGLDGLVVADDGGVVGVVSRRDIDQATHHKLAHAPVCGFMSHPVISVSANTPLSEIQRLMVKNDIGRLTVLDKKNHLLGLVSRAEVLKHLYGEREAALFLPGATGAQDGSSLITASEKQMIDLHDKLEELDEDNLWLFRAVGETAADNQMTAYAVGGSVRDLLLGVGHFDLDFVIEGSAIALAHALVEKHPDKFKIADEHERFQTATLGFSAAEAGRMPALQRHVDLSTARSEFYEYPAALPTVEPSKLDQDLFRRDFTINALAICLNPDRFGMLIDLFSGLEDLHHKTIRVLHQFSFIEDPTRIVRAARFASRLGFTLDKNTAELAKRAISMGIFDNLAGVRMRTELQLILESKHRLIGLDVLARLGAKLRYLDEELEYGVPERKLIRRAEQLLAHFAVSEPWLIYLALLLGRLNTERIQNVLARLHLAGEDRVLIMRGLELVEQLASMNKMGKSSEIYAFLHGTPDSALAIAACAGKPGSIARRMIKLYFEELKHVKTILSGQDLLTLGFTEGPSIGTALHDLLAAKLDGLVSSKEDELKYIKQHKPI